MGFRNIYIENPARLSIKNRQLIISQDQDISVPVDDIDSIVFAVAKNISFGYVKREIQFLLKSTFV